MATIISAGGALGGPNGGERRCDANCHNAIKGSRCECVCGGRYHACGSTERAVEMHTDDWLKGEAPMQLPPQEINQPRPQPPALFARLP